MIKKIALAALLLVIVSCGDDDNGATIVPPRDLADQIIEDDDLLQGYLDTHFYEIVDETNGFLNIVLDTIAGDNADKTPLSATALSDVVNVSSSHFGLGDKRLMYHTPFYYVPVREGAGQVLPLLILLW